MIKFNFENFNLNRIIMKKLSLQKARKMSANLKNTLTDISSNLDISNKMGNTYRYNICMLFKVSTE